MAEAAYPRGAPVGADIVWPAVSGHANESRRFTRDNWNYREQTSVVVRRPYSAENIGRVPDLVNKRTRLSRPAESPELPRRGAVRRGLYIPCPRPRSARDGPW